MLERVWQWMFPPISDGLKQQEGSVVQTLRELREALQCGDERRIERLHEALNREERRAD